MYNKAAKTVQWGKIVPSINGVGKLGQPYAKEWNWTPILYHTQTSTQNGSGTWI